MHVHSPARIQQPNTPMNIAVFMYIADCNIFVTNRITSGSILFNTVQYCHWNKNMALALNNAKLLPAL